MATAITTQMESELCFNKISNKAEHTITNEVEHLTETTKTCQENKEYGEKNITDVQDIVPVINQDEDRSLSASNNVDNVQSPLRKDQEGLDEMRVSPHVKTSQSATSIVNDNDSLSKKEEDFFQPKKHRAILDSGSEEENVFISNTKQKSPEIDEQNSNTEESNFFSNKMTGITVHSKHKRKLLDSDSEDDEQNQNLEHITENEDTEAKESMDQNMYKSDGKNSSKISKLIDSDSEEDTGNMFKNIAEKKNRSANKVKLFEASDESDKDDSNSVQSENLKQIMQNDLEMEAKQKLSNKLKALIDSESEDEESEVRHFPIEESTVSKSERKSKGKSEKKRKGSIRASKEEAMKQIHSETQRLLRETAVSLPYHRPKQRTLQEFLNRKKVAPTLPQAPTTAAKLKMSSEIVSKMLEEKEKEAELFYKSSDSEDEAADVASEPNENKTSKECIIKTDVSQNRTTIEDISIEETQKVMKNNVQDAHNKKEILQQGSTDLGIPRQLFGKDFSVMETNNLEEIIEKDEGENSKEGSRHEQKQLCKEHKVGLREASVPRKLFDQSEPMDTDNFTLEKDEQRSSDENNIKIAQTSEESHENKCAEDSLDDDISEQHSTNRTSLQGMLNESDSEEIDKTTCTSAKTGITETPHISNTEVAKLLHRHKEHKLTDISENQDTAEDPKETRKRASKTGKELLTFSSEIEASEKVQDSEEQNSSDERGGEVLGLPLPEIEDKTSKNVEMKKKLLSNVLNVKPKLRGSPGMIIDLTGNMKPNRQGINTLIDRFCKHTSVTKLAENVPDVTVIHMEETINGFIPVKETLPYQITSAKNEDPELSKPGAKLLRLKEDLKLKMAVKRKEEWEEKEKQQKLEEEEDPDNDERDCLKKTEVDESNDFNESEESEPESEPEENDVLIKEKRRKNHRFADDEAEVTDDDGNEDETEMNDGSDEDECDDREADVDDEEDANNSRSEEENDENDSEEDTDNAAEKKKRLRRIIQPFDEDSNSMSTRDLAEEVDNKRKTVFERSKTDVDIFESNNGNDAWINSNENDLPQDFLRSKAADQSCRTPLTKTNDILRFISPVTQLTALKGPDSNKKSSSNREDMLVEACGSVSVDDTPYAKISPNSFSFEKRLGLQKKLFDDFGEPPNDEEIMQLCSGKFPSTQACHSNMIPPIGSTMDTNVTNSQLLELCSGTFSTQDNLEKGTPKINADLPNEEESQDIQLFLNDNSPSPIKHVGGKQKSNTSSAPWSNFRIASSSDEEEGTKDTQEKLSKKKKLKKRTVKKLELSDDEDAENNSEMEEEQESDGMGENVEEMDDDEKYFDYDSEENEIVVSKKSIEKVAADFLEKEAELSESEWGSADEDEKDLDKLEVEECDDEEIDENQMKDQIGKIHMRQLLDEDQREVRLLKELLFEDGDLHTDSSGRERKFKWKNIDKLGEDHDTLRPSDDNDGLVDPLENEDDIEQIKLRHEREKFLQERKKDCDDDLENELGDSQFFKLGMKALKKIQKNKAKVEDDSASVIQSEDRLFSQTVSDILNSKNSGTKAQALYRHSLLARGEETLVRIAKVVKDTDVTSVLKRPGKFCVFTSISPVKDDTKENKEEAEVEVDISSKKSIKRKAPRGGIPRAAKKSKFDASDAIAKTLFD